MLPRLLCQVERVRCGEIAMLGVARPLEGRRHVGELRQFPADRVLQRLFDSFPGIDLH